MKTNKFNYIKVIQQFCGNQWNDANEYIANSLGNCLERDALIHDLKEYKLMGYPTRVIFRKELKQLATI